MADVGNETTISLGTQSYSGDVVSISGLEITKEVIEITNLADDEHKKFIGDRLVEIGEVTVTAYSDCSLPSPAYDYGLVLDELITITYPTPPGGSSGGVVTFGGIVSSVKASAGEMGEIMEVEFTIKGTGNSSGWSFAPGS